MQKIKPFIQLLRPANLLIIVFTMYAMRWLVIYPIYAQYPHMNFQFAEWKFALSVMAMVFLAAAGNIINDYFDVRVDRLNKPDKVIVGRLVKRRVAMVAHQGFNGLAMLIGLFLAWDMGSWFIAMVPIFMAVSLWYYSLLFKKQFFLGNFVVALMVGIVPLWAGLFELSSSLSPTGVGNISPIALVTAWKWILGFSAFAFIITLIREAQKDVEDHDGDKIVGFTTMAILWGKSGTKIYIMILTATTLVGIAVVIWQLFGGRENGIIPLIGSAVLVLFPLFASLVTTSKAKTKESFHKASRLTKLTMAGGISCSVLIAGMYLDWF